MTENTPHANVKQVLHGLAIPVVLQIINTPAPEPDIQEDLAQFAAGNILNALVNHLIHGLMGLALAPKLINTPAPEPVTPAARVLPVVENIHPAPAPADILGAMEVAPNSRLQAQVAHQVLPAALRAEDLVLTPVPRQLLAATRKLA